MIHITANTPAAKAYETPFLQGATEVISDGINHLAVWTKNTPLYHDQPIATIGDCYFLDSKKSSKLLSYTADYLKDSFSSIVGPMNGNTWLDHRLVTYSDGSPPFMLEPNTPQNWTQIFADAGFKILSSYSSSSIDITSVSQDTTKLESRFLKKGVSIRCLNSLEFTEDLKAIYRLSCISFKHNFLYTELAESLFIGKYDTAREHLDPDLILLAERNNTTVAFVFCYPDLSQPGTVIVKTLAADPRQHLPGIGNLLVAKVQERAKEKGYTKAIHALQFDNNSSLKITSRYQPSIIRRYALLARHF